MTTTGQHFGQETRFRKRAAELRALADEELDLAGDDLHAWLNSRENDLERWKQFREHMHTYRRLFKRAEMIIAKAEFHADKQIIRTDQ